jgi:hypothetical protein
MRAMKLRAAVAALLVLPAVAVGAGAQNPSAPADSAAPSYTSGATHGDSTAARRTEFHWFGKGFIAGALTGPIGTWWAVKRAARSEAEPSNDGVQLASSDPAYRQGFQQGYTRRLRTERKEYAFMGGALGTAVLTFAIIRIATMQDDASSSGDPGGGGPQFILLALPAPGFLR